MPAIHFLNVKEGDCSVIQHYSGHVTVIDVCNAKPVEILTEALSAQMALSEGGVLGNFNQKKYPINPVIYLKGHDISSVFRFILTNPDMDHMDGIRVFFDEFDPANFWDTDNAAEKDFSKGSPYSEDDWKFYKQLRDGKPTADPKRLSLFSGVRGQYYNLNEDETPGGDGLYILSPTPALVSDANETDDYNDCSYVILYRTGNYKIVFGGDSHDKTWDHILNTHKDVTDIDLLIAPHHGRDSDRSYEFLDVLKPKLTFFGNARSEYLAYDKWQNRNLDFITNNQAGCLIANAGADSMSIYVTHKPFAERVNQSTFYSEVFKAYYIYSI